MSIERNRGFTTMELMIVVGVMGLLLAASWGNIQSVLRQQRLVGATNQMVTHLRLAREKSVAEGNNYVVTFRPASNDYQIWDDEGSDTILGPADSRTAFPMPDQTIVQNPAFFGSNRVIFRPDGTWTFVNEAFARVIYSCSPEELIGENLYDLPAVGTDDPAELDAFLAAAKRKYDFEPEPEQRAKAALFRLEAR